MRIGIVTFHRATNYGAQLQAWALQSFLNQLGFDVRFLDYECMEVKETYKTISLLKLHKQNLKSNVLYLLHRCIHVKGIRQRNKVFYSFQRDYLSIDKFPNEIYYDAVICGSDQIWNPSLTGGLDSVYTLSSKDIITRLKIAYAVSGESKHLQQFHVPQSIGSNLNEFKSLSFREKNLVDLFRPYYNGKIEYCVDPTFLLSKKDWEDFGGSEPLIKGRYLFVYQVVNSKQTKQIARYYARQHGVKIIYLNSAYRFYLREKNVANAVGPREFVNLIKYADFVLTTSFHGTALSILLNKQFALVYTCLMNRQKSLLDDLGLSDRIIENAESVDSLNDINYSSISMDDFSRSSKLFLSQNLNSL